MKTINVEITGIAPLLQNRFPVEEHGQNQTKAKKKVYVPEDEAKKCLYIRDGQIFQPAEHIYQSMVRAAVDFKYEGKKTYKDVITSGILVEPEEILLISDKDYEIDARPVMIQRSRVLKWRPRFNQWKLVFKIIILDDTNINAVTLKEILDRAGTSKGIGDYRPRFGRFMVTLWSENGSIRK